uniref:D-2-hydroxyglutarate dehydrogenase, mitochondrial n=1 Tax=Meloidogyne hapla TaxID=6305 RepID=A0A1I8C0X6_MELHA
MFGKSIIRLQNINQKIFRKLSNSIKLPERRQDFAKLTKDDILVFQNLLGENNVKTKEIDDFNFDFMHWYKGNSSCVLLPENTQQISSILSHCYKRRIAVVPQSGNTGLVGGSIPMHDEIILSMKKFTKNFELDSTSGILECDSGFILEEVDNRIAKEGYMVPVDLGAKGSCLIGGVVATNAGGIRLIRYGSMHANVTGLEVGQLGVITKVFMQVVPRPLSVQSAMIGVNSFEKCQQILKLGKQMLNEIISSFEFIDGESMKMVKENADLDCPLSISSNFFLLIETSGSNEDHDSSKMDIFLTKILESGLAEDGAIRKDGYVFKHDFSLPLKYFYELPEAIRKQLNGKAKRIISFGHIGDGNVHINVSIPEYDQQIYDLLYPFVYEWVYSKGGSISAEHGIGHVKRTFHHNLINPKIREISSSIKKLFDPNGILSPYKMIDF